jgi:hypothetical protein
MRVCQKKKAKINSNDCFIKLQTLQAFIDPTIVLFMFILSFILSYWEVANLCRFIDCLNIAVGYPVIKGSDILNLILQLVMKRKMMVFNSTNINKTSNHPSTSHNNEDHDIWRWNIYTTPSPASCTEQIIYNYTIRLYDGKVWMHNGTHT